MDVGAGEDRGRWEGGGEADWAAADGAGSFHGVVCVAGRLRDRDLVLKIDEMLGM